MAGGTKAISLEDTALAGEALPMALGAAIRPLVEVIITADEVPVVVVVEAGAGVREGLLILIPRKLLKVSSHPKQYSHQVMWFYTLRTAVWGMASMNLAA